MEQFSFGALPDGRQVTAFRLKSPEGLEAVILDYGCIVQSLLVPNRDGGRTDVVLGYDTAAEYVQGHSFFGAVIGRVGNRIAGGLLEIGDRVYRLPCNNGKNHIHGGPQGFDRQLWHGEAQGERLVLSRTSPDGEEGYPGNLEVQVTYALADGALCITYDAKSDADTAVNLTNHTYFNLHGGGSVAGHVLQMAAGRFTEAGPGLLPTGRILPVAGTPLDFTAPKALGRDWDADDGQIRLGKGYDHNFVLDEGDGMKPVGRLYGPETGILMTTRTTKPGVQLYTSGSLGPTTGKGGMPLAERQGVCLETQFYPDAAHHPDFPSPILPAGAAYHHCTSYAFSLADHI